MRKIIAVNTAEEIKAVLAERTIKKEIEGIFVTVQIDMTVALGFSLRDLTATVDKVGGEPIVIFDYNGLDKKDVLLEIWPTFADTSARGIFVCHDGGYSAALRHVCRNFRVDRHRFHPWHTGEYGEYRIITPAEVGSEEVKDSRQRLIVDYRGLLEKPTGDFPWPTLVILDY